MASEAITRLPNHTSFDTLLANLGREVPSIEMNAIMSAENFGLAVAAASAGLGACRPNCDYATRKSQFDAKFKEANNQLGRLAAYLVTPQGVKRLSVDAMYTWLRNAQSHATRTGQTHLTRTAEQQTQYAQGVNVSMQQTAQTGRQGGIEQSSQQAQQELVARDQASAPSFTTKISNFFTSTPAAPPPRPLAARPPVAPSAGSPCGMPWSSSPKKDEFLAYIRDYPNKPTGAAAQQQLMCQLWANFASRQGQPSAPPPPSGPNFTDMAAGISSILAPLATVGAGAFQSQQQANLARMQARASTPAPSYGPQPQYYPPPSSGNNTLLIAGVAGGAALLLIIVVLAMR